MSQHELSDHDLKIGDLVNHVLYGNEWIGVVVGFRKDQKNTSTMPKRTIKALVQIQPETKFDGFFKRTKREDRINDNLGYVSVHWLFKIKEKYADPRSTRNKTSRS